MKKFITVAILAIAGVTSAFAGSHTEILRIECSDGSVFEKYIEVDDNASDEQIQTYKDHMYFIFCM